MSTSCTTCGQTLHPDDGRCPTCDTLSPPPVGPTVVGPDPSAADAPPWSIPIREPKPTAPAADRPDRRRTAGLAALGVVVLVAGSVVGARVLDDEDSGAASGDTAQAEPVGTDGSGGIDPDAVRSEDTTTTSTTSPTTVAPTAETTVPLPSTTTAAPTTAAPAPTTMAFAARTGPNGTGSVPALSTSFRGWLAQLKSVPYDAGTGGLADEWKRARTAVPGAVAARSDDWSAFRDGFWVLVDPGPFASADDVRAFCTSVGLTGDGECLPRELRG